MSDNPFLLPPGGATPPEKPTAPDAAPISDPSHYIAVPASVESATHRIARPAAEPEQVAPEPDPSPEPDPQPVAEETRVSPARGWALVLPDGSRTSLEGPLLLGRDPAGIPERPTAALLPLADTGKTVSKTHALFEPAAGGVLVRDLHSTNGVAIDTPLGRELLTPGGTAIAPFGATVLLGSFAIGVAAG